MEEAIKILKSGGIVIFPTDTAIGIGCRLDSENSLRKLFKIRRRPEGKPVLVLVASLEMAKKYLLPIPQDVEKKLIKKYWPGELTIILNCNTDKVPTIARGGKNTLGIRLPRDLKLVKLINDVGVPIIAPSANFSGGKTPFEFDDLDQKLVNLVDYVWREKISLQKKASTIVDCTIKPWKIIRQGSIEIKSLEQKIKKTILMIDTADNKRNIVGLEVDGKKDFLTKDVEINRTQNILLMINELLKKHKIEKKDICGIKVNIGPGSYTGLRVGLAIANAMSFALKIPVNNKKVGEIVLPIYA